MRLRLAIASPKLVRCRRLRSSPVGHRQPKAGEVPQAQELTDAEKRQKELDQALDKKLKSICRGC